MSISSERIMERACGACTVCCTALPIETRELRKAPGVACRHLERSGCAIHATRYSVCRSYSCGWLTLPWLDENFRPEKSGVVISPHDQDLPPGYTQGLEFLVAGAEAARRSNEFATAITISIAKGYATFLAVPGPIGHFSARVFLNGMLAGAVTRSDTRAVRDLIVKILKSAAGAPFEKMCEI